MVDFVKVISYQQIVVILVDTVPTNKVHARFSAEIVSKTNNTEKAAIWMPPYLGRSMRPHITLAALLKHSVLANSCQGE